jgi:hypothetical protein
MSYMFVSTFWHFCYHALMFDSLIFSDGERPVTMQPLFGVLYSVKYLIACNNPPFPCFYSLLQLFEKNKQKITKTFEICLCMFLG